jgi:hypothetical protein
MSEPPAKPLLGDVCRWCLTVTYTAPFCRQLGHWRMIQEEYEGALVRWQEMKRVESRRPVVPRNTEASSSRAEMMLGLTAGVREFLAAMGRRGGSSRSERKQAASRRNGHLAGRRQVV